MTDYNLNHSFTCSSLFISLDRLRSATLQSGLNFSIGHLIPFQISYVFARRNKTQVVRRSMNRASIFEIFRATSKEWLVAGKYDLYYITFDLSHSTR